MATALGFLVVMGSNALTPVLGLTARQMGASGVAIGATVGSLYAVRFVLGPAVDSVSDRRGDAMEAAGLPARRPPRAAGVCRRAQLRLAPVRS